MKTSLSGKTVLLTGAAGSIGQSLALELAIKQQAVVWANDVDKDKLNKLQKEAAKYGGVIKPILADVRSYEELSSMRDIILKEDRRIDVWINNAGVSGLGHLTDMSPKDFERVLDINLKGTINGTQIALAQMNKQACGTIVNMASVAGHIPAPFMSAYVASKHGIVGFTRSIRRELQFDDSPVKILLVSPGFIKSEMTENDPNFKFPPWLSWAMAKPDAVAKAIVRGITSNREEITPTLNGRLMRGAHRVMPDLTERSSKMMLAKSLKDLFLQRYDR